MLRTLFSDVGENIVVDQQCSDLLGRRILVGLRERLHLLRLSDVSILKTESSQISAASEVWEGSLRKRFTLHPLLFTPTAIPPRLVMMVRRFHPFRTGQFAGERFWIVNQHRKVLRADPELLIPVVERDERYFFRRTVASKAVGFVWHGRK